MEFFGKLSLENNGGLASVRSKAKALGLMEGDMIVARLRGDGREYYFNLGVPTRRIAFSYRASFEAKAGQWQEIKMPLKKLQATSFGRPVQSMACAGVTDPAIKANTPATSSCFITYRPVPLSSRWYTPLIESRKTEVTAIVARLVVRHQLPRPRRTRK